MNDTINDTVDLYITFILNAGVRPGVKIQH